MQSTIWILSLFSLTLASHHSEPINIPIEHYQTELQNLGQHVEIPETPVKIIKITKTVAIKIPVPYPVKITERVPYPVHVPKPYPVHVPQIIRVPHGEHQEAHEGVGQPGVDYEQLTYQKYQQPPQNGGSYLPSPYAQPQYNQYEGSNDGQLNDHSGNQENIETFGNDQDSYQLPHLTNQEENFQH